jgi:hypothetical protein
MEQTSNWGLCIKCKWWQVEPDAALASTTHGFCIEQSLQPYLLRVSGGSGCGLFVEGEPARAAGSGDCPPTAAPTR